MSQERTMKLFFILLIFLLIILNFCYTTLIFSSGKNDRGQLGVGNTIDSNTLQEINTDNIETGKIVTMASSGLVKLLITDTKELYSWGDDSSTGV